MIFAFDTEVALASTAALVNTAGATPDDDTLTDRAAVDAFVAEWGFTGSRTHDDEELETVRALRPRLRAAFTGDRDSVAELANTMLREGRALPQLVRHDEWDYHLHATAPDQSLAVRMAVEAAMALVDVVRTDSTDRLRVCADSSCDDVFVDLSKNRSRRFCSVTCSNRTNTAAHRARAATRGSHRHTAD